MTRGQRTAHRLIWMVLAPLGALLLVAMMLARPPVVGPGGLPAPPGEGGP